MKGSFFSLLLSVLLLVANCRHKKNSDRYKWIDYKSMIGAVSVNSDEVIPVPGTPVSSILGNQHLYVSIACIRARINHVGTTVRGLLNGTIVPTHIFVMISEESFLFDTGVKPFEVPYDLILLQNTNLVSIGKI